VLAEHFYLLYIVTDILSTSIIIAVMSSDVKIKIHTHIQWQKLAKRYSVIVLAWGASWPDCRPVRLLPRSDSCSGVAVSVRAHHLGGPTYRLRLFKAVTGQMSESHKAVGLYMTGYDQSNIQPSQGRMFDRSWPGAFDRLRNLTGHIAYRIFDQLPIKYLVP